MIVIMLLSNVPICLDYYSDSSYTHVATVAALSELKWSNKRKPNLRTYVYIQILTTFSDYILLSENMYKCRLLGLLAPKI